MATNNSDVIFGSPGADWLAGLGGNDLILGYGGNDILDGGDGNDKLDGGDGSDLLTGGRGDDVYVIDTTSDQVIESANWGIDLVKLYGGWSYTLPNHVENFELFGSSKTASGNDLNNVISDQTTDLFDAGSTLRGLGGDDKINAGEGSDQLWGGTGDDRLYGQDDDDALQGERGDDLLSGGNGDDFLNGYATGSSEHDTLTGGAGRDTFALGSYSELYYTGNGLATITDFNSAQGDRIQVFTSRSLRLDDYDLIQIGADVHIRAGSTDVYGIVENARAGQVDAALIAAYLPPG
jgi:Ca2+-binding RTX toxin-like protein